ncbi:hypothetical protein LJB99_00865 [Deltaproteobacteria bacterium OttesenSCG-928-K17]|nr:hypothetical protein [Deltaproteobacteria bacterium OttesenSCG-928-K17]
MSQAFILRRCPILAVASAELKNFWSGASAGVSLLVFLGLLGFFMYNSIASYVIDSLGAAARGQSLDAQAALFSQGLTHVPLILMLVTPLVTMRALAPSRRGGGLDFFQTLPLGDGTMVAGQYLAALTSLFLLCLLALVPFATLLLMDIGSPELLLTSAIGFLALSSAFAAIGLWASAAFPSPVGAGLATLGVLGLMWVLGWAAPYSEDGFGLIWRGAAFAPRMVRFVIGLVAWGDLAFFAAVSILGLANAKLWLGLRRHSGAD